MGGGQSLFNTMKFILSLIVTLAFAVSALAEVNLLPRLSSETVAHAATNSAMTGVPIGWDIDQVACVQITTSATNAAAGAILTLNWDTSNDASNWKTAAYTTAVAQSGVTVVRLTNSVGPQYLRAGTIGNTNTITQGTITITQFNYVPKQ
jgi:hypothetical protein